jgi:hypothetical protein
MTTSVATQVRANIQTLVGAYCRATGVSQATASKRICGRGNLVAELMAGERRITFDFIDTMLGRAHEAWPEGAPWPMLPPITMHRHVPKPKRRKPHA